MAKGEQRVVVLGSGPSAFFLVRSLLKQDPRCRVTVLEAGLQPFDTLPSLGSRSSQAQPFRLDPTLNIGYGGTSQLWHNVLAPLDPVDFQERPWIPLSGWPISMQDLEKGYEAACEFFGFSYEVFRDPGRFLDLKAALSSLQFDDQVFRHKTFVHPRRYLRTHIAFDALLKQESRLSVRKGAVGLRFETQGAEESLLIFDRNEGVVERIQADRFVLCCGAINSAEILLNSPAYAALPFLGRCLMDHPMGNYFQFRYPQKIRAKIYSGQGFSRGMAMRLAWTLTPERQAEEGLGNSAFYLRPAFAAGPEDATERLKLQLLTVRKKLGQFKVPLAEGWALARNLNMAAQIVQYKTGMLSSHRLTDCMFVTEQRPASESRLTLTGRENEFGNRTVSVHWALGQADLAEAPSFHRHVTRSLMDLNGAVETFDAAQLAWDQRLSSAAHHLGTVRMARSAEFGCVDADLRVFSSQKVFVCDGSVFPTAGNANPTLTCMALGARLARFLAHA